MKILYSKCIAIAILAGEKILQNYGRLGFELKEDKSPITQADWISHLTIVDGLREISEFPICSEEKIILSYEREKSEYYWLVDPLDGTRDFIAQTKHFTVNIALMHKNVPIFGVIYIPALKKLYAGGEKIGFWGLRGKDIISFCAHPSWNKLKKLNYNSRTRKHLIGCDSVFHQTDEGRAYFKKHGLRQILVGSSIKFCILSIGIVDIYPRFNGSREWDTAAGDAILRSVGGFLYDLTTKDVLQYGKEDLKNNFFIAFSPRLINSCKYFL